MAEINYKVVMQGLTENIIALERFAPDLKRELTKKFVAFLHQLFLRQKATFQAMIKYILQDGQKVASNDLMASAH
jgi:hypothetical protein